MKITLFLFFCVLPSVLGLYFESFKMTHNFDVHQDRRFNHQRNFIKQPEISTQQTQRTNTRKLSALMKDAMFLKVSANLYFGILFYFNSISIIARKTKTSRKRIAGILTREIAINVFMS